MISNHQIEHKLDTINEDELKNGEVTQETIFNNKLADLTSYNDDALIESAFESLIDMLKLPMPYFLLSKLYAHENLKSLNGFLNHPKEKCRFLASKLIRNMFLDKPFEMETIKSYNNGEIITSLVNLTPNFTNPRYLKSNLQTLHIFLTDNKDTINSLNQDILNLNNLSRILTLTQLVISIQKIGEMSKHEDWGSCNSKILSSIDSINKDLKINFIPRNSTDSGRLSITSSEAE